MADFRNPLGNRTRNLLQDLQDRQAARNRRIDQIREIGGLEPIERERPVEDTFFRGYTPHNPYFTVGRRRDRDTEDHILMGLRRQFAEHMEREREIQREQEWHRQLHEIMDALPVQGILNRPSDFPYYYSIFGEKYYKDNEQAVSVLKEDWSTDGSYLED